MQKIIKKFCKEYFADDSKSIKKDITAFIEQKQLAHRRELEDVIEALYKFFVVTLAKGDESKARHMLEAQNMEIRKVDAVRIAFLAGISLVLIIFSLFFAVLPTTKKDEKLAHKQLDSALTVYRFVFIFSYILLATGFCVQIFVKFNINYLYIFELNA